jgi:hypothetical protein
MARLVLTNVQVEFVVGPTTYDLSDHIASISLSTVHDIIDTTQFGDISKRRIAGLGDNSVTFEFHQDFQAGSVESIIYPLLGTAVLCNVKPVNGLTTSSNPEYSFQVLISEWTPLNGAVGDISTATVQWPISGDITKTT